jgi:hypothetical protein
MLDKEKEEIWVGMDYVRGDLIMFSKRGFSL